MAPPAPSPLSSSVVVRRWKLLKIDLLFLHVIAVFCRGDVYLVAAARTEDDRRRQQQRQQQPQEPPYYYEYALIGVSGTLQDGFPLRQRLDYYSHIDRNDYHDDHFTTTESYDAANSKEQRHLLPTTPAILIGRALVRGFKSYLDVKDPGWREYIASSSSSKTDTATTADDSTEVASIPPLPNAVVIPTQCWEHANLYYIYAVDTRQVAHILSNEPRFLGITPDTGLIELQEHQFTDSLIRHVAYSQIRQQNKTDFHHVAIPLVVGVWFHSSFVESPYESILHDDDHDDALITHVTSYEDSLALWAGVAADDLTCPSTTTTVAGARSRLPCPSTTKAWERVYEAVRRAESVSPDHIPPHPATIECQKRVRFGVTPTQARLNTPIPSSELLELLEQSKIDEPIDAKIE